MKLLNGADITGFIKERQARQVRGLRQAHNIVPHLAIIQTNSEPIVNSYMKLKRGYGEDILAKVTVHTIGQDEAISLIKKLNKDASVHGIIVQLPLPDKSQTAEIIDTVDQNKDVDGLAQESVFEPATPLAIDWLLAGYNVELKNKRLLIIGQGRLVGKPLAAMWRASGYQVITANSKIKDLKAETKAADVIVCATGRPGILTADMIKPNVIIVDAGVATDNNGLIGDVSPEIREMPDITITPVKGGVGPLTVSALFDNVIRAAQMTVKGK